MTEATLLGHERLPQGYCAGSLLKATVIFVDFGVYQYVRLRLQNYRIDKYNHITSNFILCRHRNVHGLVLRSSTLAPNPVDPLSRDPRPMSH